MSNNIKAVVIGEDTISLKSALIIKNIYNKILKDQGENIEISVCHFVSIQENNCKFADDLEHTSVINLEEMMRLYNANEIQMIIVPFGVSQCVLPILLADGMNVKSIFCMSEEILAQKETEEDYKNLSLADILTPFEKCGYLHKSIDGSRDYTNRFLGRKMHTCRICGYSGECESITAREMMQGKREEFEYFICPQCNCMQIASVPDNLGDYYGKGYYSFSVQEDPNREFESPIQNTEKILDVGCGSGAWLVDMAEQGFGNLHGVDPFLEKDIRHGDRVFIKSCSIHELTEYNTYDHIRFGDSFEHPPT